MPSPTKEATAPTHGYTFAHTTDLLPPPSPRTHRALRKLQSAHNLGSRASASSQPSLITQQRLQQQQVLSTPHRDLSHTHGSAAATPPSINTSPAASHHVRQRARANSDAPPMGQHLNSTPANKRSMMGINPRYTHISLAQLIREGPPEGDIPEALGAARRKVLSEGIKTDTDGMSPLRIYAWLIFLDAPILPTDDYLGLIHRGASPAYSKIRNDTFRTLTTDPLFRRRVSEASLIRLLNAVAWKLHDAREAQRLRDRPSIQESAVAASSSASASGSTTRPSTSHSRPSSQGGGSTSSPAAKHRARALTLTTEASSNDPALASEPGTYVQGMNVLAAPFLYAARSETEAFVAFHTLLTRECPAYIRGAMDGVHRGVALVDRVLATVDSRLSGYLLSKGLSAELYAFPSVLTLCACTPPLPEVLRLWDFLFAYGPHLNILCIVAQLMGMRDQLMNSPNPNRLLRAFPSLQADKVIERTLWIIERIPDVIYAVIVTHAL
ncbi:cell division control protein [Sodiomyces alkalinus F11]|uniref:Cell division control protein n=1 Tax=Sodiomyces alkalinus (strain CBS 110278 / VKM F-3762 / F11) TaxID=1314773 RepID=A0A3N2Q078_SODAK|nr:cell division control protein [Sodiomyces alkalinus F11]ROT40086.1 cell division control protein [Sodiomyces alkalinus F11]